MPKKTEWWSWLEGQMFERGGMDYTQVRLGKELDLRQSTISEWKNVGKLPEDKIVIRVAFLFDVDVAELFKLLRRTVPDERTILLEQTWMMLRQLNVENQGRVLKEIKEIYNAQKAEQADPDDDT